MDPDSEFEIDPEIAAAMGFGGFGTQNKAKRKFDNNDGFVDPAINSTPQGTGANNMPMRDRKTAKTSSAEIRNADPAPSATEASSSASTSTTAAYDPKTHPSPSLEVLRNGVRNQQGDMVYFMPSFLEDPWAGLRGSRGERSGKQ